MSKDFPPYTSDFGPPDRFSGQLLYLADQNTLVIGGARFTRIDQGYACGRSNAVLIFSGRGGGAALLSHPPYCGICPTCWHKCGKSQCPDWDHCGQEIGGGYGFIVTFPSMGFLWMCMGKIGYSSTSFP